MKQKKNQAQPGSEPTRGTGDESARNRSSESSDSSSRESGSGISNRSMEEELSEQEELPERGTRQSER